MSEKNFASYGDMETLLTEIASEMTSNRVVANPIGQTTDTLTALEVGGTKYAVACSVPEIINLIYPIGSIYMSVNSTNPSTLFGGTWELLGDGYLRNNASAASGGSLTSGSTILTDEQIPSHSHTATTQSTGAHTHTSTTQSTGLHTHTSRTESYGNHTHTATTGNQSANHTHAYGDHVIFDQVKSGTGYYNNLSKQSSDGSGWTLNSNSIATGNNSANHTHTLRTENTGAHSHTLTTSSVGEHAHTLTTSSAGNHTHTLTTNSIGGGKGHTHSIEPTYIGIYAFKRTA